MPAIAIFLHQLAATGVARNALAIARAMQDAGWDTRIVTVEPGGELAGEAERVAQVVLGAGKLPRGLALAAAVPALRRHLKASTPDILLSAGNHAHLAVVAATRAMQRPLRVYRISNDLAHGGGGPFAALSPRRLSARLIVGDAAGLVLVSPALANEPVLAAALKSGKARVIANGVDVAQVRQLAQAPCEHPWFRDGSPPVVLAVGRLVAQKNFGRLVEAFALARAERPLRLIIVGGGKPEAQVALEAQAQALGVGADIGFVPRQANPFPYYRHASVLALPSLWEGSPNVLLEALACGVPVVASRTAGNAPEILDQGRYGVLVDPTDGPAIARGILAQLAPDTRISPGSRAEAFDRTRALIAYRELFEFLLTR